MTRDDHGVREAIREVPGLQVERGQLTVQLWGYGVREGRRGGSKGANFTFSCGGMG